MLYWNQLFTRVFPEEDVEMKHRTVNDYFKQQWPRLILFAAFTLGVSFFAPLKNFQLKWLIDSKSKQEALGYMGLVFAITFSSWFFERLSRRSFTRIASAFWSRCCTAPWPSTTPRATRLTSLS